MTLLSQLAALGAIGGAGVVYGTDAFCALVQRPALARVDDATLTAVMGNVHRLADRRMPAPGIVAAAAAAGLAGRSCRPDRLVGDSGSGVPPLGGLLASAEFAADMRGFDVSSNVKVEELLLDPV